MLVHLSTESHGQANLILKEQPFKGKIFEVPENHRSVKALGNNITDIILKAPVNVLPRNEVVSILSYAVIDTGNYLVIWKAKARDTTTFYPNSPDALAIDSAATAWLSLNGEGTEMGKDLLLKQFTEGADKINDKLSFLSIPLDHSEVMHLNKNDTLSLTATLYGNLKSGPEKQNLLPLDLLTSCAITDAEMILIKIDNKD